MVKSAAKRDGGKPAPVKVKVGRAAKAAAASKKPKKARPLPKSWPVASHLKYPPSNGNSNGMDGRGFDLSASELHTSLQPGKTLQQNCNGCDVFLRKGAVQSTSAAIIPTKENSTSKGAVKRFLIVFPGRMTLKAPPPPAASKDDTTKETDLDDQNEDKTTNNNDVEDDNNTATKPAKRNPFAPSNPHQLLGRLVSLGGAEQKVELRIPLPTHNGNNDTADNFGSNNSNTDKTQLEQQHSQIVMSGKAIPLSGKFMALSFKRTGGKVSSSAASTPKNKKMGTGSINCKDIFRSVIVLGESKVLDNCDKKGEVVDAKEEMKPCHYGGSERTVDGGGKNEGKVCSTEAKGRLKATAPTPLKRSHDEDDSILADSSSESDNDQEDDEIIALDDGNSDDEFVPTSSRKRRSLGAAKKADSDEDTPVTRKRTPRRSTASTKIKYVDSDSDVDMSDDDSTKSDSGKSNKVTQDVDESSDDSVVVEEILETKKRSAGTTCKKRKLSNGSSRSGDDEDSSLIVIDSEDDVHPPKKWSKTNGSKRANGSTVATSKSNAGAGKTAPSSPPKSVSPRRRKKVSPKKPSPKKHFPLDLDDDPFTFL